MPPFHYVVMRNDVFDATLAINVILCVKEVYNTNTHEKVALLYILGIIQHTKGMSYFNSQPKSLQYESERELRTTVELFCSCTQFYQKK